MQSVKLTNQWNDFLLRQVDPYAMAKYEVLISWLGDVKNKTCLVVGSGSGEFPSLLAKLGADVLAIDIDLNSVELTRKTAERFGVRVRVKVDRLETFSTEQAFDIVAATDVIEHIGNDEAAASQLTRLVRRNGKLLITVPALQLLYGYHDEILGHFRRYSRMRLIKLFSPLIHISHARYFGFFLVPVALLISKWLRRPYPVRAAGEAEKKNSFFGRIVKFIFNFEKKNDSTYGHKSPTYR